MSDRTSLRMITYLSPGIPVEVFEGIMGYLEETLGMEASLLYESRWTGPPENRTNPFAADQVDMGFMDTTSFLRLVQDKSNNIELCEAGAVHLHSKNTERPIRYSDIVIHSGNNKKFKELHDLRGHSFAFSSTTSLTSCLVVLEHLRKTGFDASFFGDKFESGSHVASLKAVLDSRVEAAAVDSSVVAGFLTSHPYYKDKLEVIMSLGPLPTYPIVLNSKLSDKLKAKITQALLDMNKNIKWNNFLQSYKMAGFAPLDSSAFSMEKELISTLKGKTMAATYY